MPETRERASRLLVYWLIWAAVLFGIWFVLVDSLDHLEVATGALAAPLAAWAALRVRRKGGGRFHFRLRWLAVLGPVPLGILRDTGLVWGALWRRVVRRERVGGVFRAVRYAACEADPASAAWRALTIIGTSVTPNAIVVGIDREQGVALVHQLVATSPAQLRRAVIGADGAPEREAP